MLDCMCTPLYPATQMHTALHYLHVEPKKRVNSRTIF